MEIFTAFFVEYHLQGRLIQSYLIMPSYEACQVIIRDNEDMAEYYFADGDVDMYCIEMGRLSKSIRPVLREEKK